MDRQIQAYKRSRTHSSTQAKKPKTANALRRPMIGRNFSVAVVVSDAKASARWFEEKLGFQTAVEGHWVTAWPKGASWRIHLCESPRYEPEPGNSGIAFYCDE